MVVGWEGDSVRMRGNGVEVDFVKCGFLRSVEWLRLVLCLCREKKAMEWDREEGEIGTIMSTGSSLGGNNGWGPERHTGDEKLEGQGPGEHKTMLE